MGNRDSNRKSYPESYPANAVAGRGIWGDRLEQPRRISAIFATDPDLWAQIDAETGTTVINAND